MAEGRHLDRRTDREETNFQRPMPFIPDFMNIEENLDFDGQSLPDDFLDRLHLDDLNDDELYQEWDDPHMLPDGFPMELAASYFPEISSASPKSNFPSGPEVMANCLICFEYVELHNRLCCDFPACGTCMETYLIYEVERGVVKVECINGSCKSYVHRDEILSRLPVATKEKYYKFLVDANKDPCMKTCPRCSHVYQIEPQGKGEHKDKFGLLVTCPECRLDWCFSCHAPWHTGVTCKDYRKGDKLLRTWAKESHYGQPNAQRCPKCKIFIERKGGCDHMVCSKCNSSFCYRCGERYCDLKFFGNHMSRYSPFGCKYIYKPDKPVTRRLVRGSVFGAKMLGGVLLLGLGAAAGAVLLGASVVVLPVVGGYKLHRRRQIRRHLKRQHALFKMTTKLAMMESLRERAGRERLNAGQLSDFVHLGLQTGESQQVEVMVHHPEPSQQDSSEQGVNSEIRMNIKDDKGRVTITTAEISHNEGAEVILHVTTSYDKQQGGGAVAQGPSIRADSQSDSDDDDSDWSLDRTSQYSRGWRSHEERSKGMSSDPHDLTRRAGSKRSTEDKGSDSWKGREPVDDPAVNTEESMTQSFLKLFSKRLNDLQVQLDRAERDKSLSPKSEQKEKDKAERPDIGSHVLETEKKRKLSDLGVKEPDTASARKPSLTSNSGDGLAEKATAVDPYYGVVSNESCDTAF